METNLFISDKYTPASSGARFVDIEPGTERPSAEVSDASAEDVERAVSAAREAADSYSDAKFLVVDLKLVNPQRSPLGVGAIIIPWNSPLMLGTWNLGPCLATGNACIYKPSELAPLTAIAVGEIALEAGLPPGVLNILPGQGVAGAALVSHPAVDGLAFTGGVATGRRVMAAAAESLKWVTLELGGKSPNLVFADADLKRSAAGVSRSIFRSQEFWTEPKLMCPTYSEGETRDG
jgi:acyl-CoA reductase-like NAD-dependent aldehyde dehydrogenase